VRCLVLLLVGCRCEPPARPVVADASPDARLIDARQVAPQIDAHPACEPRAFSFGTFEVPAGWCWRRTAEGDDLSGELDDDHDVARMTYQQLAHGEQVDDVCRKRPERTSERSETVAGVRVHACVLANGHHCYAFPNTNMCTTDAGFDSDALIRTLHAH
jgi:hypothetical protein